MSDKNSRLPRRSFISWVSTGAAAVGVTLGAGVRAAGAQSSGPETAPWKPVRHAEDEWLDKIPGTHRFFFDTLTPQGLGQSIFFVNNYFGASRTGYGLDPSQLAVVVGVRHHSTCFAYSDAIWAKYGVPLAERAEFVDPKTKEAPKTNLFLASGYGPLLTNNGVSLEAILTRGVQLAVCQMATRGNANAIAQRTGAKVDDIYQELVSNLVPNSHMVPAGIVALNHAQERGYSFAYGG